MKRIIYHWTAGTYKPNMQDLTHYHYLIDDKGVVHHGVYAVEDNESCLDGVYAAHTGGGNTGSIGIAFCGMRGYKDPTQIGDFPLTQKQLEAGWRLGASLVKMHNLDMEDEYTIQTHYGFGTRFPKSTSAGKIDITFLPSMPNIRKEDIEALFYNKVSWYLDRV
jgi:hypothetical protein